jgi:hypothetical protein
MSALEHISTNYQNVFVKLIILITSVVVPPQEFKILASCYGTLG